MPRQQGAQHGPATSEHDVGAQLARRGDRAGDDLSRSVVAAHGVDGDQLVRCSVRRDLGVVLLAAGLAVGGRRAGR